MKLPFTWLAEFVDINKNINSVAEDFYNLGFGVESIINDVLDLEITPNRGDALSILGLAREYCALNNLSLKYNINDIPNTKKIGSFNVNISTNKISNYYCAVIENLKINKSPDWMIDRLNHIGIKSINPIVDITNYVMYELGHPMHAFDLSKINNEIIIKESKKNDKVKLLNGKRYILDKGCLVAYDNKNIIDLVGIQGAENSAISYKTNKILLQVLIPDKLCIRKTSKDLKLVTDASYRFERGIDPKITQSAFSRALNLIREICQGKVTQIIVKNDKYHIKKIKLDFNLIKKLVGIEINQKTAIEILDRLGFKYHKNYFIIPSWRQGDINYQEDLVEEILRIWGYNKIPKLTLPTGKSSPLPTDIIWQKRNRLSDILINYGFNEIMTYSFISKNNAILNNLNLLEVKNPLSLENQFLRNSLIPLLIDAAEKNTWSQDIKLFEIGTIFLDKSEQTNVAIISTKKNNDIGLNQQVTQTGINNKLRRKYYILETSVELLLSNIKNVEPKYKPMIRPFRDISKFSPVERDLSIIVNKNILINDIVTTIYQFSSNILNVSLFDEYININLGNTNKGLAFHIIFDNMKKPLSNNEILSEMDRLSKNLIKNFNVEIR